MSLGARRGGLAIMVAIALITLASGARAQEFVFEFGGPGANEPERLGSAASSVAVDADGNPWVADPANNRIVKYDYSGDYVAQFTSFGDVPVKVPSAIAADDQGYLYVAQGYSETRIAKINTGGTLARKIQLSLPGGLPLAPDKIAVDGSGRLYVSDGLNSVQVYSQDGVRRGEIRLPAGWSVEDVAVGGGEIFVSFQTLVADQGGIRRYRSDLTLLNTIGPFDGVSFHELDVDPAGRIDVADYRNSVARRYNRTGGEIDRIGTRGIDVGQMNGPQGLAIDCRGSIYVLDSAARYDSGDVHRAGSKVLKFSVGGSPPPCAARPLPAGAIDTQVNDVEVTQAVQPPLSYSADPSGSKVRTRAYGSSNSGPSGEVRVKATLPTVVRVYANLHAGPAGGIGNVPATLEAVARGGRRLGPIQPVGTPPLLRVGGSTVAGALRTNAVAVYSFLLPDDWTRNGSIDLIARVNPAHLGCDRQCQNRSTFRLTDVPFGTIRVAPIAPIALTDGGVAPIKDPRRAFEQAQHVTPLLLEVQGWRTQAEVGDLLHAASVTVERCFIGIWPCSTDTYAKGTDEYRSALQGELEDRLDDAADDADINGCYTVPMGLVSGANNQLPGATWGEFLAQGLNPCALSFATVTRPLTAVAHELQHAFSRRHAGQNCPGTGPGDDQEGDQWPPDNRGLLGGIGLNTTLRGGSSGPFALLAPGVGGRPAELFDLMSYCARTDDSDVWISPRGWDDLSGWRVSAPTARPQRAPSKPGQGSERLLRVTAIETPSGELGITGVSPTTVAEPAGDPASPYVLEARDANRTVLASRRVAAQKATEGRGKTLMGTVPAPSGTMQVFLRRGNEIGTVREGSPSPPTVKLTAPRAGARASKAKLVVRWQASDPDGGPLIARVEYSANGGKKWEGVYVGPDSGRAAIPRSTLTGSNRARVRVRVHDGFNEAVATSKQFTVVPPAPQPRITEPAGKVTIRADSPLELRGDAIGAGGRRISPTRLHWFDGRHRLGRGGALTVSSLRTGRHRIALQVVQNGKTGRTSILVKVRAVKPAFLRLDAPAKLSRRARSVRLSVASTVEATLRVEGKRFPVSPRARRVALAVRPGKGKLRLHLQLSAGRLSTRRILTIPRG